MILRDLRLIVFGGKVWKGWGWGWLEEGIFNGRGGVRLLGFIQGFRGLIDDEFDDRQIDMLM